MICRKIVTEIKSLTTKTPTLPLQCLQHFIAHLRHHVIQTNYSITLRSSLTGAEFWISIKQWTHSVISGWRLSQIEYEFLIKLLCSQQINHRPVIRSHLHDATPKSHHTTISIITSYVICHLPPNLNCRILFVLILLNSNLFHFYS